MAAGDTHPLTPPRIYLVRMGVFLVLAGFVAFILYRQIWNALKRMTQAYSADERALMFSGVATRTYRLEPVR